MGLVRLNRQACYSANAAGVGDLRKVRGHRLDAFERKRTTVAMRNQPQHSGIRRVSEEGKLKPKNNYGDRIRR